MPWQQQARGGTRKDRTFDFVDATIPPFIGQLHFTPTVRSTVIMEKALQDIAGVNASAAGHSSALSQFMLRSESVASSKIEKISASAKDYALATAGRRSDPSAVSMVAASTALHELVAKVGVRGRFVLEDFLDAHAALMADDPHKAAYIGKLRDMQNWIGGSDYSPRGALYVPPSPERVPALMDDLLVYLNRDDIPILVQATIAHAQFESIHPFTDGNGRIGRALISAVLKRRKLALDTVIPLASGILARRDKYFSALISYQQGNPEPLLTLIANSAHAGAQCSKDTIARLKSIPQDWAVVLRPRAGSALAALVEQFYHHPIMSSHELEARSGAAASQAYRAIDRLVAAGFIEEITGRKKNRAWAVSEVLAELDDLDRRIQDAMP